jgi:hypothetical protein
LFGFVGLIVAVPILATVKILIEELWTKPLERNGRPRRLGPAAENRGELVSVADGSEH